MFTLSSKRALTMYLNRMTLKCGINKNFFDVLQINVSKLKTADKHCIIMFDEISLQAHIDFSKKEDNILGFVDNGTTKNNEFADHALVFMARGIRRTWKQPVAFTFCKGAAREPELVRQLKNILQALLNIGNSDSM